MNAYILTECVVSLAVLVFVCLLQFKRLSRDDFRADIRRLRDGLFDFVWKNGYSFDDPAYRGMRRVLNGLLRLSNHATPIKLLVVAVQCEMAERRGVVQEDPVPSTRNASLQREISRVRREATNRFLKFVFLEGLRGYIIRVLLVYPSRATRWLARFRNRIREEGSDFLVQKGYALGNPDLSPEESAVFGY